MRRQAGFTLLEMIAVIAVIAMLAAILLPNLPHATTRPRLEGYAIEAAALTMLAFTGIVLAFTAGYYRESQETLGLRRRLGALGRKLRTAQGHLEVTRRDIEASDRAYRLTEDDPAIPTVSETVYGSGSGAGTGASPGAASNGSVTRG